MDEQQQVQRSVKDLARASRVPSIYLALMAAVAGIGAFFDPTGFLAAVAIIIGLVGLGLGIWIGHWRKPFLSVGRASETLETFALVRQVPGKQRRFPGMEVLFRRARLRSAEVHFRAKGSRLSNPIPWGLVRQGLNKLVLVSGPSSPKTSSPHLALLLAVNGIPLTPPNGPPVWLRWEDVRSPSGNIPEPTPPIRHPYAAGSAVRSILIIAVVCAVGAALLVSGPNAIAPSFPSPHLLSGLDVPEAGSPHALGQERSTGPTTPLDSYCLSSTCDGILIVDLTLNATEGIAVGKDVCGVDQSQQTVLNPFGGPDVPDVPCPTSGWHAGDTIYVGIVPPAFGTSGTCHISWGDGSTFDSGCGYQYSTTHVYSVSGNETVTAYLCYPGGGCDSPASVNVYINPGLGSGAVVAGVVGLGLGAVGIVPVAGGGMGAAGVPSSAAFGSPGSTPYFPEGFDGSGGIWGGQGDGWMDPYTYMEASLWSPPTNLPPPPFSAPSPSWIPQLPPPGPQPVTEVLSDSLIVPANSEGVVNMAATISVQGGDPTQPFTYTWRADDGTTYSCTGGSDSSFSHWFQKPGTHTLSVTVSQNGRVVLPTKTFVQTWGAA